MTGPNLITFLTYVLLVMNVAPFLVLRRSVSALATKAPHTITNSQHYTPPSWAQDVLSNTPKHGRLTLANLPTPLYQLHFCDPLTATLPAWKSLLIELDIKLFIKRDDMTGGVELGGNKIRKLEFLLADALAEGYESVITIGGEQSNHCRATAATARMVGLRPHLILRTKRANDVHQHKSNFGLTGNILIDRMVGSQIYTCTPGEYGRIGSDALVSRLGTYLEKSTGAKPYPIPVGGSNGLGSWGYINGVNELLDQWSDKNGKLDHVVFACGSGGTAAGICLGLALAYASSPSTSPPLVHSVGVCDDPDYFYNYVAALADEMGFQHSLTSKDFVRKHMIVHQGKGLGYASSTPEELNFVTQFAIDTGIVLDPVYSGKALYHFLTNVLPNDRETYRSKTILFWHTGGALGLFDKEKDLLPMLREVAPVTRLDVYGKDDEEMVPI